MMKLNLKSEEVITFGGSSGYRVMNTTSLIVYHTVQIMVLNRKSKMAQFCSHFLYCLYLYNSPLKGFLKLLRDFKDI